MARLHFVCKLLLSLVVALPAALFFASSSASTTETTPPLNVARRGHAAVALDGGRVMIIGGENRTGPVKEVEIFDPGARTFALAAELPIPRADLTATRLADGRILIAGGRDQSGAGTATEIYSPISGAFSPPGPHLQRARAGHSATLLADGRVLIAGGDQQGSAELFDPATGRSALTPALLKTARSFHSAVRLRDGRVLLVGGMRPGGDSPGSAEIFDPETATFSVTANPPQGARIRPTLHVLPDGKVQVLGGDESGSMEIYDVESGLFTACGHPLSGSRTLSQVLRSRTRATLLRLKRATPKGRSGIAAPAAGEAGEFAGRVGFSLTEVEGGTLIAGGEDDSGQVLSSTSLFTQSSATITTDRSDYHPGDTVVISGGGWQAGEMVRLTLHRDNDADDTVLQAVADQNGEITDAGYVCQETDLGVTFILTAEGLSSGYVAQTTFTDSPPGIIDPPAQVIPYAQDFAAMPHTATAYPAGWQGWRLANSPSSAFRTTDAIANEALRAGSTAATTASGAHNYSGKVGFLATGTADPALCLAVDTTGSSDISVRFDVMTIRNPYNGAGDTKITQVDLQYRVGISGPFASLSGSPSGVYQNDTTQQTGAVTTPQNLQTKSFTLPPACDDQPVVQLRWVQREVSGGGSRPSFAVDNLTICPRPGSGGTISGPSTVCAGATGLAYSVSAVSAATTYTWSVPAGAVITSGQGTASIVVDWGVDWGAASGDVTVTPGNPCASGPSSTLYVMVRGAPAAAVSGGGTVCEGGSVTIAATLTGAGPWDITWSDGVTQAGILVSPATRTVNPAVTTTYTVTSVSEAGCAGTASGSATVITGDTSPPAITLNGASPMTVECHATFDDPGAGATDDCAGPVTITRSGNVDVGTAGTYTLIYTAVDAAGNTAAATRTVNVVDTTPPTVTPPASVVVYTGAGASECGKVVSDAALGMATGADLCGQVEVSRSGVQAGNLFPVGVTTVMYTATDQAGNRATGTQTVTVIDHTPPELICPENVVVTAAAGATAATATFATAASDNCSVAASLSSPPSGASFPVGVTTVTSVATDLAGSTANCSFSVTVRPTAVVTVVPTSGQYSDTATLTARVTAMTFPGQMLTGQVQFRIDGSPVGLPVPVPGGGGDVSLPWPLDYAPGSYGLTAQFVSASPFYAGNVGGAALTVTAEDARAVYTGALFAATGCATCATATVTLSATVQDITAAAGDEAYDATAGDIRNATVTFINRDTNAPINPTPLPVGLVSSGDRKTGTVTYNWSVNLGAADSLSVTVGLVVGKYYVQHLPGDNAVVTVSRPLATNFLTGGGYLLLSASAGEKAGDPGSKCNWGFNVKYNSGGKNLQGNVNILVRRVEGGVVRVYQIKSNALTSLSLVSATGRAVFSGKASLQDVTDQLNPIAVDGNATLHVTVADNGEPGGGDTLAITVWNKQGGLWFASHWDGVKTLEQPLAGGNLVVR